LKQLEAEDAEIIHNAVIRSFVQSSTKERPKHMDVAVVTHNTITAIMFVVAIIMVIVKR
jgi:hypothetical protein